MISRPGLVTEPVRVCFYFFAIDTSEQVVIGDYDGDGKDDIATWLSTTSKQLYVALSLGTGMGAAGVWVDSIGKDATDVIASGDANGDGRADLIAFARTEGKVYVALSDGTKFGTPTVWHGFFAVSTYERPRVADVNGDGKADIVTFATDSPTAFGDVYVATSNGTRFVGPTGLENDSSKWHDFFAIQQTEQIRIGDLNGDGRDDFFTFLPPPFAQCYTVLSQGTFMAGNVLWAEAVAPLVTDQTLRGRCQRRREGGRHHLRPEAGEGVRFHRPLVTSTSAACPRVTSTRPAGASLDGHRTSAPYPRRSG